MKKAIGFLLAGIILAVGFTVNAQEATQTLLNPWKILSGYITARNATNGLKVPALSSGGDCVVTDASGIFSTASCGTGGGGGASTTIAGLSPSNGVFIIATSSSGTNFTFSTSSPRTLTFTFPASPTFTNLTYTGQGTFGLASGTSASLSGNLWVTGQTTLGNASSSALTVSGLSRFASTTVTGTLSVTGSTTISSLGTGIVQSTSGGALYVVPTNTYQAAGTYVTNVTASGNIASSGGTTPNITFTGVLPLASGGIATTTLGNLTVSSANLSITGGQQVLIGTSTQITLTGTPSFTTLTVTGQTTLATASSTALTVSGNSWLNGVNSLATTSITGTLSVTGVPTLSGVSNCTGSSFLQISSGLFSCGTPAGGGGGAGGGWATSTTANGLIITNTSGGAVGINSSTPWATLVVQGTSASTTPLLIVASSTGRSILTVASAGYVAINSTSTPTNSSLLALNLNGATNNLLSWSIGGLTTAYAGNSNILFGGTPSTDFAILAANAINIGVSGNAIASISIDSAGKVGINSTTPIGTLAVTGIAGGAAPFVVASSTGTILLQVNTNGSTTLSSLASSNCDVMASAAGSLYCGANGGGGGSPGGSGGQVQYNNGGSFAGSAALLTNGTVSGVNATSSTTSFLVQGTSNLIPFKVASSTGTAIMTVSADGDVTLNRTNSAYTQTQFVISSALAGGTIFSIDAYGALSGSSGAYTINGSTLKLNSNGGTALLTNYNNSNNSNLQIYTGYGFSGLNANQYLQLGYSGSGSVLNSYILNGVGKTTIGTVAPTPGTSTVTTPSLLVEDTSGNSIAPIFAVASSTNTIILQVNYDGKVGINTSTPVADFQATNQTSSATTTIEFGRAGQGKGTCMKIYDPAGVAWYVSVSVSGTLSASASTCKTGF